jgi:hypothetical protein
VLRRVPRLRAADRGPEPDTGLLQRTKPGGAAAEARCGIPAPGGAVAEPHCGAPAPRHRRAKAGASAEFVESKTAEDRRPSLEISPKGKT